MVFGRNNPQFNMRCGLLAVLFLLSCRVMLPMPVAGQGSTDCTCDSTVRTPRSTATRGCGVGFHAVLSVPEVHNIFAATSGMEITNLLGKRMRFRDKTTGLRVEQEASQDYKRFYLGARGVDMATVLCDPLLARVSPSCITESIPTVLFRMISTRTMRPDRNCAAIQRRQSATSSHSEVRSTCRTL